MRSKIEASIVDGNETIGEVFRPFRNQEVLLLAGLDKSFAQLSAVAFLGSLDTLNSGAEKVDAGEEFLKQLIELETLATVKPSELPAQRQERLQQGRAFALAQNIREQFAVLQKDKLISNLLMKVPEEKKEMMAYAHRHLPHHMREAGMSEEEIATKLEEIGFPKEPR
jgi:hypothetical protein